MDLHAGGVPGDEAVPNGRIGMEDGRHSGGSVGGVKTALAVCQKDGRN